MQTNHMKWQSQLSSKRQCGLLEVKMSKDNQLSPEDAEIMAAVSAGEVERLRTLLSSRTEPADFCDGDGVTPLQHASFKGDVRMVRLLLDQGVDVNFGKHEYNYTALHFGALSGNSEVCQMLMDAGVKIIAKNSVGRTAAQMAAFVGNHAVVSKINNFVPKSCVDYFTKIHGTETTPLLPPEIAEQVHKFIMDINLNPVRVALNLQRYPGMLENLEKVQKVLSIMSETEFVKGGDHSEVISFKLHYLSYLVSEINDVRTKHLASKELKETDNESGKKFEFFELFTRKLLKPSKDGVTCEYQDSFLKEGIRKFPFRQSVIFRQAVYTLAQKDAPSTLSVVDSAINGQRGFTNTVSYCNTCGEEKPAKKCSKCKSVQYCDRECQRLHWFVHKKACTRLANAPVVQHPPKEHNVDTVELSQQLQDLVTTS